MSIRRRVLLSAVTGLTGLTGAALLAVATPAPAAVPSTAPPVATASAANAVRATALPTAQQNGVAYAQVIIGDTVYVGGSFTEARPAGVAAGGAGEVARSNLLAYSLSTGALVASFAPVVNNTVKALAASPDGTRLYVGGLFTAVDGVARYRIASFDTATGGLVSTFKPVPNYVVQSIVATDKAVYFGGKFDNVGGVTRGNLAAVVKDTGALMKWAPVADAAVQAMVLTPDSRHMVLAGKFEHLNGTEARGLGSVRIADSATVPFAVNQVVYAYGTKAAFLSLSTDGKAVYGTAYVQNGTGNLEGSFSADPDTGAVNWIEDCHGDTYGVWSSGTTVYTVGHAHYCRNIGGFPQVQPSSAAHRAIAFTAAAAGTVQTNGQNGYENLAGNPAPSLRQWFPDLPAGDVTGADQAAWTVTGSGKYVVMAGEFPEVNGAAQQGLVRFAMTPISPDTLGPTLNGAGWAVAAKSLGSGSARVTFRVNWDRDDLTLRYVVSRDDGAGTTAATVYSANVKATEWTDRTISVTDTGRAAGTTYRYRVSATDSAGNVATSSFVSVTT